MTMVAGALALAATSAPAWSDPSEPAPNRLRTAVELTLINGLGMTWYWIDRERQIADWDFPSWRDRFSTSIFINDTNPFVTNFSWHLFGGSSYHLAGRSNDLGVFESALWGLWASLVWEYGVEYREKVDLNDIIFTTPAGMAAGEFFHWIGRYLQQAPAGRGWDALRWTLGFPHTFHDHLDGRRGPRGPEISHHFRVSFGAATVSADRRDGSNRSEAQARLGHVRFEGALTVLDEPFPPGRAWRGFRQANFPSVKARLTMGSEGDRGSDFFADTMLAGWRRTDVAPAGDVGTAVNLGTAVAVRYHRERYGVWRDRLGVVHLPGPAVDGEVRGRGWRLTGKARAHLDYGGVHAQSAPRWFQAHPDEVGKSIIEKQGYYYAWGGSGRLQTELSTSWLALGGEIFYGRYRSQQGFDRHQAEVTIDQLVNDRFIDYELWLRGRLHRELFVELRGSGHHRQEQLEEFDAGGRLTRYSVELGTTF
jgi:hypothetical protein